MMRKGGAANILDGSSSLVELFVLLLFVLFLLFRQWYDLNASDCILCLSAGRPECGGLPEDGMCQPRSGHQELLQGAADKNAARLEMFYTRGLKTTCRFTFQALLQPRVLLSCPLLWTSYSHTRLFILVCRDSFLSSAHFLLYRRCSCL